MKRKLLCALCALTILVCILCAPACAEETEAFVFDVAGILSESEVASLNEAAKEVSLRHGCGVYIAIFGDMGDYGFSYIESFSEEVYHQWELGIGEDRNGIVLVMSMADRDYDLCAYGEAAHTAFTDYGKEVLADEFKDDFRRDDWAGGFSDYVSQCDYMLQRAAEGDPIDIPSGGGYVVRYTILQRIGRAIMPGVIIGIIIAFIYCSGLKRKMRSARIAREASAYLAARGIFMQAENDMFTHTTVTRQRIEHDNDRGSHGGTSVNSGGFSHSSGKF